MKVPQPPAVPITGEDVAAANHRSRALHQRINLLQNRPQLNPKGPRLKLPDPKLLPRASSVLRHHDADGVVLDSSP